MIVINSPNNPTGAVYPREVLEKIADLAIKRNISVLSDEIYEKIIYDKSIHTSIASIPGMENRTITLNGFSKSYAMTGWRLGYVVANRKLMLPMLKVHQNSISCVPTFTQYGASPALTSAQRSVNQMVESYKRRRDIVYKGLSDIEGITCNLPQGTFYAFPKINNNKLSSKEFANKLLNEVGVAVVPGSVFSCLGEGYVRLSYATSETLLKEAICRIRSFIKK